jgi:RimJ/RimL family protein N-acetyltransferase
MMKENKINRIRFLEGERIYLTPTTMDDFDHHYRWDHDRQLVFLDDKHFRPKSYSKAKEEFEKRLNDYDNCSFMIILKEDNSTMGLAEIYSIDDYERRGYWGIVLAQAYWNKGYGSEVARLIFRYAFEELGLRRLKSYTHSGNPVSMKFQEKLGFVKEGVLRQEFFFNGKYYDGIDYGMLKEEYIKLYVEGQAASES